MEQYYIIEKKEKKGPFNLENLIEMDLEENTLVWRRGLPDWTPLKDLSEYRQNIPPPLPNTVHTVPSENIQHIENKVRREIRKNPFPKVSVIEKPFAKWVFFIILYFLYRVLFSLFQISFISNQVTSIACLIPSAVTAAFIIAIWKSIINKYRFEINKNSTPRKLLYFGVSLTFGAMMLIIFSNKYGIYEVVIIYFILVSFFRSLLLGGFDWLENFPIINRRGGQLFLGIGSMLTIPLALFVLYPKFILSGKINIQQTAITSGMKTSNADTVEKYATMEVGRSGLTILLPIEASIIKDSSWREKGTNSSTINENTFKLAGSNSISGSIDFIETSIPMKNRFPFRTTLNKQVKSILNTFQIKDIKDTSFNSLEKVGLEGDYFSGKFVVEDSSGLNKFYFMTMFLSDNKTRIWNIILFKNGDEKDYYKELHMIINSIRIRK